MKTIRSAVAILLCTFALAGAARAHTQLSASTPANDAVVAAAPSEISLTFSDAVRLTAVSIVSAAATHTLDVDASMPAEEFVLAIPSLAAGTYTIRWRAMAEDTHVMTGEIRFSISS